MDLPTKCIWMAAQEGCDGEPYDTLQEAGFHIRSLRSRIAILKMAEKNAFLSGFNKAIENREYSDPEECWFDYQRLRPEIGKGESDDSV